jgi:cobalamin biosynthesis Mg chelatase CobN
MSEENLNDVLDDKADYLAYKRKMTIEKLGQRTHLKLSQIAVLCGHEEHGKIVGDITLQELLDVKLAEAAPSSDVEEEDDVEEEPVKAKPKRKVTKRPAAAKKTTAKKKVAKKATKKPAAKKKAAKKKVAKKAAQPANGRKADFGKKKPRLDYKQGMKEVLGAIKAAGGPCGRSDIEEVTSYTGVQVRTFAKKLAAEGKIKILGKGGRSTKYAIA